MKGSFRCMGHRQKYSCRTTTPGCERLCALLPLQAKVEVAKLGAAIQAALGAAQQQLLPVVRSFLRAFALAAAVSSRALTLPTCEWHAAEAAACADALQAFVALGALVGAAGVAGSQAVVALGAWLGQGEAAADTWQALLGQQVLGTLREADAAYLEVALARANGLEEAAGEALQRDTTEP
jgi:hypothetical protein